MPAAATESFLMRAYNEVRQLAGRPSQPQRRSLDTVTEGAASAGSRQPPVMPASSGRHDTFEYKVVPQAAQNQRRCNRRSPAIS